MAAMWESFAPTVLTSTDNQKFQRMLKRGLDCGDLSKTRILDRSGIEHEAVAPGGDVLIYGWEPTADGYVMWVNAGD